jgi:hypothetical protein
VLRAPRAALAAVLLVTLGAITLRAAHTLPYATRRRQFSIAFYTGASPLSLAPTAPGPALTARDVTDLRARDVADPFLFRDGHAWQLFFEVVDAWTGRGVIATARSEDGRRFRYGGVVLREPFHLSYPHVFAWEGAVYMVPEAAASGHVRLYRSTMFPGGWQRVADLLARGYSDPTPVRWHDRWWLFASGGDDTLWLFVADALSGPWRPHPRSPVVRGDPHHARPAGRVVELDGRLVRFAQDDAPTYGLGVSAFEITTLTAEDYAERPLGRVLAGSGRGWNARGMHQLDAWPLDGGRWLAAVDGWDKRFAFGFREWR